MAFKFRLQALMTLRQTLKEQAEQELARWIARRQNILDIIKQLEDQIEIHQATLSKAISKGLKSYEYQQQVDFLNNLIRKLQYRKDQLIGVEEHLENAKKLLQKRHAELKAVETLKEKAFLKYLKEQQRREQVEADEFATIRYTNTHRHQESTS